MPTRTLLPLLVSACMALCACGGGGGSAPRPAQPGPAPAELQEGDLHIRASAIPTLQLADSVARDYGITRGGDRVLLLVAVRRGPEAAETTVPARVEGWATDLRGRRQPLALRALRTGALVDHIAEVEVSAPDTLHFQSHGHARGRLAAATGFRARVPSLTR